MTALEKYLGRPLTEDDQAVADACGDLQSLALICIREGVPVATARVLRAYMAGVFEHHAMEAAKLAAELVAKHTLPPRTMGGPTSTH